MCFKLGPAPLRRGDALVKRGRLNRIGVGRLARRAGTFKVYSRVEERDPLELRHDPVLLAGNNYQPENSPNGG